MNTQPGSWWAVALSESVTHQKPLAVVCDGAELVLFRNAQGQACALEDRCPHRRVPLSLGTIHGNGLQCCYHGWTFDGCSGACVSIPNLGPDERVPQRYAAQAYRVTEANGFVQVWMGQGAGHAELPPVAQAPEGPAFTGQAVVGLPHEQYLAVMMDGPQCLLRFDGITLTDFFLGDTERRDDRLVLDRGAHWSRQRLAYFQDDFPLLLRTAVPTAGGLVRVQLLTADERPLVSLQIGSTANRRDTTSLCWRGHLHSANLGHTPLRWRAARALKKPPFEVIPRVDSAAVAALLVAPSADLAAARAQRTVVPIHAVAG